MQDNVKLQIVKSVEADIDDKPVFILKDYGIDPSYRQEPTNSSSNERFNIHLAFPNGQYGLLDRFLIIEQDVTLTFGTNASGSLQNILQSGFDSFQSYPLTSCMSNFNFTMKTQQISLPISDIINPTMWYAKRMDLLRSYGTPCCQDRKTSLNDMVNTVNNPMGSVYDTPLAGLDESRGSFPYTIVSNSPTAAVITATLQEPVFISSLLLDPRCKRNAIAGIDSVDVSVSYRSNPENFMWSHATDSTSNSLDSISVAFGVPKLTAKFMDASLNDRKNIQSDKIYTYPYYYPDLLTTQFGSINSGAVFLNKPSNSITLKAIPQSIYIWVGKEYNTRTFNDAHSYLSIEAIDVNFSSKHSLASASKIQLFNVAQENNYRGSWTDWSGIPTAVALGSSAAVNVAGGGCVLKLVFGKDIQLPYGSYPSQIGTYHFAINISATNRSAATIASAVLYMLPVYSGTLSIQNNRVWTNIGVLTNKNVEVATIEANIKEEHQEMKQQEMKMERAQMINQVVATKGDVSAIDLANIDLQVEGAVDTAAGFAGAYIGGASIAGSFLGDVGSFFKRRVFPFAKKVLKSPIVRSLLKELIGLGYSERQAKEILKGRMAAGQLVKVRGGKVYNKRKLLNNLRAIEY